VIRGVHFPHNQTRNLTTFLTLGGPQLDPNFNITTAELCAALGGVSRMSVHNWMKGYPRAAHGNEVAFRLSDVVTALRDHRCSGLKGNDLSNVAAVDMSNRPYAAPDLALGDGVPARSTALMIALIGHERRRLAGVKVSFCSGLVTALWADSASADENYLSSLLIAHPAVLSAVLTDDRTGIPALDDERGWRGWSLSFWTAHRRTFEQLAA
jgi:hypothetical protein